jgi:O-antigen ligase
MLKNWWPYVIIVGILTSFLIVKFAFYPVVLVVFILAVLLCFLYFEQALMLLAFLVPFENAFSLSLKGLHLRISDVLIIVLFLAWLVKSLAAKSLKIFWDQSFFFLLFYLLIAGLSLRFSPNFSRGLQVFGFTTFVFFAFWFLMQLFREQPQRLFKFLRVLFISAITVCILGLLQFAGDFVGLPIWLTGIGIQYTKAILGFPRVRSTFSEPLYFGSFIILILPLVYVQLNSAKKLLAQPWLKILFLLLLLNLFLTFARSSYLAFAVELLIIVVASIKLFLKPRILRLIAVFILLVVAFLFSLYNFPQIYPSKVQSALSHVVSISDFSSLNRLDTDAVAQKLFQNSPIKGIGIGQFGPAYANYPVKEPISGWQTVNNEPLELLAENGILGFLPILLFYLYLLFRQIKALINAKTQFLRNLNFGFLLALIGIAVSWQFFSTLYVFYIFAFFALALGLSYINDEDLASVIPAIYSERSRTKAGIHEIDSGSSPE